MDEMGGIYSSLNQLFEDDFDIDVNETKYFHDYLESGETVEMEFLFYLDHFNEYELVYGTLIDHEHSNNVRWKFNASELE
jgi:hypothetical protein